MSGFVSMIIAAAGLGLLILVHEFGHYLTAKILGIRVEEFSVGFGRYLVSRRWGETVYGISLVPLGGYVRVTGMHEEDFQARVDAVRGSAESRKDAESRITGASAIGNAEVAETPPERRYYLRPVWQRITFISSGVFMNVVAAFVLMLLVAVFGYYQPTTTIEQVEKDSPAHIAGIEAGDQILGVAGERVNKWQEAQETILDHPQEDVEILIERGGTELILRARLDTRQEGQGGYLGVAPGVEKMHPGPGASVRFAAERTYALFAMTVQGISMMITGEAEVTGEGGIAGPVGIVSMSSQAVKGGYFLSLLAFISVQLSILNMLPLLPLDGGHVAVNLVEKVLGRRVSLKTFESVSMVGIALFLFLVVVATGNDVGRLLSGGFGP